MLAKRRVQIACGANLVPNILSVRDPDVQDWYATVRLMCVRLIVRALVHHHCIH